MIFFLVTCIILVIVVIVQAATAALAYIFWSWFQAAANCDVRYGVCQCTNSNGESIPIERKSGCVVRLEVYRESRRRNRRRRKLIQSQVSAAWLCFSKRSISVLLHPLQCSVRIENTWKSARLESRCRASHS